MSKFVKCWAYVERLMWAVVERLRRVRTSNGNSVKVELSQTQFTCVQIFFHPHRNVWEDRRSMLFENIIGFHRAHVAKIKKKNWNETMLTSQNEPNPLFRITHFPPFGYDRTTPCHLFLRSQISISFARISKSFSGMHKSKRRISKRIIYYFFCPTNDALDCWHYWTILLLVSLFTYKFIRIQWRIYMCVDENSVGMKSVTFCESEI